MSNHITSGAPGEPELYNKLFDKTLVKRLPDDAVAVRVSLGQPHTAAAEPRSYLVFRGDPDEVLALLKRSVDAMQKARNELKGD